MKTLISIGGIVAAGGIFFAFTQPAYDTVQALGAQIHEYNQALDKAAELQSLKQSLLSRYNAFNPADLERLQKLLPDHVDNVRLVLDLDNMALRHGMSLQDVIISNPNQARERDVIGTLADARQTHDSLNIKFGLQGSYQNFTTFLQDLESALRITDIASLSIGRLAERTQTDPLFSYEIAIKTYWLK
ncbi:MAG: type 4a pilus biogenesis protein PilO [Parcubacteria group bacterium]|nr:type 4a pilus biogenesis protein PilO [Parcubacteria group bacterium]